MTSPSSGSQIFLVIGRAHKGGAEGQIVRLAVELKRIGYAVDVYFLAAGGPLTSVLDEGGVKWRVMQPIQSLNPLLRRVLLLLGVGRLTWRMWRAQPDVICAWLPSAIWCALIPARLVTRAKRVAGLRGHILASEVRMAGPLLRSALRSAHAVTVNTPTLEDEAIDWGADPTRIVFIPNGVDLPVEVAHVSRQPPTAVVVANFRAYKGHADLFQACRLVGAEVTIRLCGSGPERTALEGQVRTLELSRVIVFADEPADISRELTCAQFAIHPSRTEGLSNAILEQLSHGLPVIAMNVGGNGQLISDGINGRLVESGDIVGLASAINEMAESPEMRVAMSEMARTSAARFAWESCRDAYSRLFSALTSGMAPQVQS